MAGKLLFTLNLALSFLSIIILASPPSTQFKKNNNYKNLPRTQLRFKKLLEKTLVRKSEEFSNHSVIFHLEGALLKSSSHFPYFMLVAFEAGGLLRALVLLLLYPFIRLVGVKLGLKIMVFVSFLGIKKEKFRMGSSVLHKFFLEDVGCEAFDVVLRCKRKVAVTEFPRIMAEGFLKDYIGVDCVIGRELKVVNGYFMGVMEAKTTGGDVVDEILGEEKMTYSNVICVGGFNHMSLDQQFFSHSTEIYSVTESEKRKWQNLPRTKYPNPLIFHDGRLAFMPTPISTLTMFMWLPLGFLLFIIRVSVTVLLPYKVLIPILSLSGIRARVSKSNPIKITDQDTKPRSTLYVCNHRTLLDPIYLSVILMKPLTAVTYSLSRFNEMISPIKTVRLTRDREIDKTTMEKMLCQGDLVVCPEGTTCREPYLLRFSPLFAEVTDEIVPVGLDMKVSMFYGSTASGFKCLDSAFQLMNPNPVYNIKILEKLGSSNTSGSGGKSRFEVANYVQAEIGGALGFECTNLTRKDKYMILAGNEGII